MNGIPQDWAAVGETSNTRYFHPETGVLVGVPHRGSVDDEASARQNVEFQNAFFQAHPPGGVVIIFIDNLVSQDKGARRVYQAGPDLSVFFATALVGGSLLSRAIGSFFLGIARPAVPIKMFAAQGEALAWAREVYAAATSKEHRP